MFRLIKRLILLVLLIFLLGFVISVVSIGKSVYENCEKAQNLNEGDCVTALLKYIDDENVPIVDKNKAIWALGQLADSRALNSLRTYEQNLELDQYEIQKAIKWSSTKKNVLARLWRPLFLEGSDN